MSDLLNHVKELSNKELIKFIKNRIVANRRSTEFFNKVLDEVDMRLECALTTEELDHLFKIAVRATCKEIFDLMAVNNDRNELVDRLLDMINDPIKLENIIREIANESKC